QPPGCGDPGRLAVERVVLLPGRRPATGAQHGRAAHGAQQQRTAEGTNRTLQAAAQAVGAGALEQEAGHAVVDRVDQATGRMRNREAAEALRVHLAEAAGLEARWHQQEVRTGEHPPGQPFLEADEGSYGAGEAAHQGGHLRLHLRLAATDDHDLAAGGHDLRRHLAGDVQALLVHQARDDREQRAAVVRQAERGAYRARVEMAVAAVGRAETRRQGTVGGRVPAVVDAVDDLAEVSLRGPPGQQLVQATALLRPHDLRRIADADGADAGCVDDPGLEERKPAM